MLVKTGIHFDQLCYETDLQELKDSNNEKLVEQLELGLTLVLDFNEERQIKDAKKTQHHHGESVSIYLDTMSTVF